LPMTAAEDLLEIVICRYERAWHPAHFQSAGGALGRPLGDVAAVTAML